MNNPSTNRKLKAEIATYSYKSLGSSYRDRSDSFAILLLSGALFFSSAKTVEQTKGAEAAPAEKRSPA